MSAALAQLIFWAVIVPAFVFAAANRADAQRRGDRRTGWPAGDPPCGY